MSLYFLLDKIGASFNLLRLLNGSILKGAMLIAIQFNIITFRMEPFNCMYVLGSKK